MSLIPKIKIGRDNSRSEFRLMSNTHATSEIGYVSPTWSKSVIPNSIVNIATRTGVRLSPLFVPTMGKLEVRHYHDFVQYDKIWSPFDAFVARKPFSYPNGTTAVPTKCPSIVVGNLIRQRMTHITMSDVPLNQINVSLRGSLTMSIATDFPNHELFSYSDVTSTSGVYGSGTDRLGLAMNNYLRDGQTLNPLHDTQDSHISSYYGVAGFIGWSNGEISGLNSTPNSITQDSFSCRLLNSTQYYTGYEQKLNELSFPTFDNCDFRVAWKVGNDGTSDRYIYFCYNFNGAWKRLRSIFLGLGYCFNPFDNQLVTPFKLLAFYRMYWNHFGVNRNRNFSDSWCAKLGSYMSSFNGTTYYADGFYTATSSTISTYLWGLLDDLCSCTYTTPVDYFSSSVTNTQQGLVDTGTISVYSDVTGVSTSASAAVSPTTTPVMQTNNAIGVKIAQRLLRFVNKYSVIGSKVADILDARFGNVSVDDESSENVQRIGAVSTPVEIDAVYSNSETSDMPLGSYAGLGVGGAKNKSFRFESKNFGTIITLTAVVPAMGYFQGMFRENSDGVVDANDFYNPEFDALGWQSVRYNELVADRQFEFVNSDGTSIVRGTGIGIFGYQPFYTHLKVPFNRVLGDISLPHMQDSMLPYTLDRFFKQTDSLPVNSPQEFRSGTQGNTNRIFQVTSPTDDHVIMQIVFDVTMYAPMKSIATSYDTFDETTDHTIDVSHE